MKKLLLIVAILYSSNLLAGTVGGGGPRGVTEEFAASTRLFFEIANSNQTHIQIMNENFEINKIDENQKTIYLDSMDDQSKTVILRAVDQIQN